MENPMRTLLLQTAVLLLLPAQGLRADECDDRYKDARETSESARSAVAEKDYAQAAARLEDAASQFDEVADLQGCRCPKIHRASEESAELARAKAAEYTRLAGEKEVAGRYNEAREKFNEAVGQAQTRDWDSAAATFEEAARMWDDIASSSDGETGRNAGSSAKNAREAAEKVRKQAESETR